MTNLDRFKAGEIVLHTPTQELYDGMNTKKTRVRNHSSLMMYGNNNSWNSCIIVTLTNKDFEEEHQMTKEDLKVGQVVELRDNSKYLGYTGRTYPMLGDSMHYLLIENIKDDLTHIYNPDWDITKVYTTDNLVQVLGGNYDSLELIWSRENPEVAAMKANVAKMEAELENMKENLRKMEEM